MATYKELVEQIRELEKQAVVARKTEIASAVEQVREIMKQYGLTASDLLASEKKDTAKVFNGARIPVKPMYRNPETGATWTGRGKPPRWIADKDRTRFRIA